MAQLIFFCGHAGTGKTTLAKKLFPHLLQGSGQPFCFLDKDTLYGRYSAAVMGALTGNPNDRDSPAYLQTLRDPEYQGLLDTARENLRLGVNVVLVGPLSKEVKSKHLLDTTWLQVVPSTKVQVVWVSLTEMEAQRRITLRNNPNDAWKLAHWQDYRQRLFAPDAAHYPELLLFDNSAPASDALSRTEQYVLAQLLR